MLTDRAIINLKPKEKGYKRSDSGGLHLFVSPSGGKLWRLKYRFNGKEKLLSLGSYPTVTLARARQRREEAKVLLSEGIDPSEHKKTVQSCPEGESPNSFERLAREWHLRQRNGWSQSHGDRILTRLENDVFPFIGKKDIAEIKPLELLEVIRRIEDRGALETAHRTLQNCRKVFSYAIATERAERDITYSLKETLPPVKTKHYPTIVDPKEVGQLLRAIDEFQGHFVIQCALKLSPLFFVRPGELRRAEWCEFNLPDAVWTIPEERMKMKEKHIVPLSKQAIAILKELHQFSGEGRYLFPSIRTNNRPISDNTINATLRRIGYSKEEMTAHGFRSMASTLLNEQGWNRDAIERQLAHAERNKIRASYNFAEYLQERTVMMQVWADYLDNLKQGYIVSPAKLITDEQKVILRNKSITNIQ